MRRSEIWLVNLDPTVGSEIQKTRPAVVVSPDELNEHLNTVIVVPLTKGRAYAFRVPTRLQRKPGVAALDQIRTVDKKRLVRRIGVLDKPTADKILVGLIDLFAP